MRKVLTVLLVTLVFLIVNSSAFSIEGNEKIDNENNLFKLNKTAVYKSSENEIDIKLEIDPEAYLNEKKSKPIDIIFVIDQSTSMKNYIYKYQREENYISVFELNNPQITHADHLTYYEIYYHTENGYEPVSIEVSFDLIIRDQSGNELMKLPRDYLYNIDKSELRYNLYLLEDQQINNDLIQSIESVKLSLRKFVDLVNDDYETTSKEHRISILGFANGRMSDLNHHYHGSEIITSNIDYYKEVNNCNLNMYEHYFTRYKHSKYDNQCEISSFEDYLFKSLWEVNLKKQLNNAIENIGIKGFSHTSIGLEMAYKLAEHNSLNKREQVVIVITDGHPNGDNENELDGIYTIQAGNTAINEANKIKKLGIPVYSIGINSSAQEDGYFNKTAFLDFLSSNQFRESPMIENMETIYEDSSDSYYYQIDNEIELNNALQNIFYKETKYTENISRDGQIKIVDTMTDQFQVEEDTEIRIYKEFLNNNIKVDVSEEVDYYIDTQNNRIVLDKLENIFDIGKKEEEYRLIVKFSALRKKGFIGGNNVLTNKAESGIYLDDKLTTPFPLPMVNVPLKFELSPSDQAIFLSNELNLNNLFNGKEQFTYNIGDDKFHIDGINNMYVDIVLSIHKGSETIGEVFIPSGKKLDNLALTDLNGLFKDEKISVTYKVTPTYQIDGGVLPIDVKKSVNIFVYKPIIEAKDSSSLLGEPMDIKYNLPEESDILWTNENTKLKPDGEKPNVKLKVDNVDSLYLQESRLFEFNVLLNDIDYTKYLFEQGKNVFNHFITGNKLKVRKNVDKKFQEDDTFVFNLHWDRPEYLKHFENYDVSFTLKGNDEVIINNLPVGNYQLCEDINWSWRYSTKESCYEFSLKNDDNIIEFNNLLENKRTNGVEVVVENIFNE